MFYHANINYYYYYYYFQFLFNQTFLQVTSGLWILAMMLEIKNECHLNYKNVINLLELPVIATSLVLI